MKSHAWQLSGDKNLVSQRRGRQESKGMSDSAAIRPKEEKRSLWASLQRNSSETPEESRGRDLDSAQHLCCFQSPSGRRGENGLGRA